MADRIRLEQCDVHQMPQPDETADLIVSRSTIHHWADPPQAFREVFRLAGASDPQSGLPSNVTLFPNSIEPSSLVPDERFGKFSQTGEINSPYAAFTPGGVCPLAS